MFCDKCGTAVRNGIRYCPECGYPLPGPDVTAPVAAPVTQAPTDAEQGKKKGSGGFFSSPAGIALVVIVGVAVLAGIVFGGILIFRGSANNKVDAATMEVWEDYEKLLEEDSEDVVQIQMDTTSLTAAQEDLKKSQARVAALQEIQEEKGGTDDFRKNPNVKPANTRDIKAEQMATALEAYKAYVRKMIEYITALNTALAGNQLINPDVVNNLNKILTELQNLAKTVKESNGEFIADNDQAGERTDQDWGVFTAGKTWAGQTEKKVNEAIAAEQARIQSETAAAQQAAETAEQQATEQQQSESAGQRITCPECGGLGYFVFSDGSTKTCPNCEGKGWYWAPY